MVDGQGSPDTEIGKPHEMVRTTPEGFKVNGVNEPSLLVGLRSIDGKSLPEDVREKMVKDNDWVRSHGLTHQQLGGYLRGLVERFEDEKEDPSDPKMYHQIVRDHARISLMGERVAEVGRRNYEIVTTNEAGEEESFFFADVNPDEISRYGIYEAYSPSSSSISDENKPKNDITPQVIAKIAGFVKE